MSGLRIERKDKGLAVMCNCGKPHAYLVGGKARFQSRHDKEKHPLELTPEELRALADKVEREGGVTWRV